MVVRPMNLYQPMHEQEEPHIPVTINHARGNEKLKRWNKGVHGEDRTQGGHAHMHAQCGMQAYGTATLSFHPRQEGFFV